MAETEAGAMTAVAPFCKTCGQLNTEAVTEALWDIYSRLPDGRQHREGLVFDGQWLNENVIDDEDVEVLNLTMERDMAARGLCVSCGRPSLAGVNPDDVMSEEDARELAEIAAEEAAERRAGC